MVVCLDKRFDGDLDPNDAAGGGQFLEVNLRSECESFVQFLWQRFTHTMTNHSSFETYSVDWTSAGFLVQNLAPGTRRKVVSTSLKSCTEDDTGADFIRIGPQRAPMVSVKTAPACAPGWALLEDLKLIKDLLASLDGPDPEPGSPFGDPSVITLVTILSGGAIDGPDQPLCSMTSSMTGFQTGDFSYAVKIDNHTDSSLQIGTDLPLGQDKPQGVVVTLDAGSSYEARLVVSGRGVAREPIAIEGALSMFDGCQSTQVGYSAIVPKELAARALGGSLVEAKPDLY